jgi:uncharacterized Zn finger protein (UPF0148 family)
MPRIIMLQSTHVMFDSTQHICPECAAPLAAFATPSTDPGYVCPTHGKFVVTGSSEDFGFWSASVETQRRALRSAKVVAAPREPPIVILYA